MFTQFFDDFELSKRDTGLALGDLSFIAVTTLPLVIVQMRSVLKLLGRTKFKFKKSLLDFWAKIGSIFSSLFVL